MRAKYKEIAKDAERLERLYRSEKLTLGEIADEYDTTYATLRKAFDEAGLEIRSQGGGARDQQPLYEELAEKHEEKLKELYRNKLLTTAEIGDHFDCSGDTINRSFDVIGIERQAIYKRLAEYNDLNSLYIDDELSTYDIAEGFGIDPETVSQALRHADIESRPQGWQIQSPTVNTPFNENELAYLAALIDGEGHVALSEYKGYIGDYQPKLRIKIGSKELVEWMSETFCHSITKEPRPEDRMDMWIWKPARIRDIWAILHSVKPYLIFKKDVVEDVLNHISDNYSRYITDEDPDRCEFVEQTPEPNIVENYTAGIFDGEGNIEVYSTGQGYKCPRISVQMGCKKTIEWLSDKHGGPVYHRPRDQDGWSDMWQWQIQSQDQVEQVLESVLNNMIVRKNNAERVLAHIRSK